MTVRPGKVRKAVKVNVACVHILVEDVFDSLHFIHCLPKVGLHAF